MKKRHIIACIFAIISHLFFLNTALAQSAQETIYKATGVHTNKFLGILKNYREQLLSASTLSRRAPSLSRFDRQQNCQIVGYAIQQIGLRNTKLFPYISESLINITTSTLRFSKNFIKALAEAKVGDLPQQDWDYFLRHKSGQMKRKRNAYGRSRRKKRRLSVNKQDHIQLSHKKLKNIYENNFLRKTVDNGNVCRTTITPTKFNVGKSNKLSNVEMAFPIWIFSSNGVEQTIDTLTRGKHIAGTENHHLTQQRYDTVLPLDKNTHKCFNKLLHNTKKYKKGTKVNRSEFNKMVSRLSKARGAKCTIQIIEYMLNPSTGSIPAIVQLLYLTYGNDLIIKEDEEMEDADEEVSKTLPYSKRRIFKAPRNKRRS